MAENQYKVDFFLNRSKNKPLSKDFPSVTCKNVFLNNETRSERDPRTVRTVLNKSGDNCIQAEMWWNQTNQNRARQSQHVDTQTQDLEATQWDATKRD